MMFWLLLLVLVVVLCRRCDSSCIVAPGGSARIFSSTQSSSCVLFAAKKGFGGTAATSSSSSSSTSSSTGGFGRKQKTADKTTQKQVWKQLEKTYGGTSPQDIAQGTARRIEELRAQLPPHLLSATTLYQELQLHNARLASLDLLQQANLPSSVLDGAKRAQAELERLYVTHAMTETDVRNAFQKLTWDASADAKAARSITGTMSSVVQERVERACRVVSEAVQMRSNNSTRKEGRCLDVGCGFGVLVPTLIECGLKPSAIHGVDLSPEMIRHARNLQPRGVHFEAVDFLHDYNKDTKDGFDSIIFCSSLHDIPDMSLALEKASRLLTPGGKLVILHAQGATHVVQQLKANPILVKRGLPDAEELETLPGLKLIVKPAAAGSPEETKEGYLAVLEKHG